MHDLTKQKIEPPEPQRRSPIPESTGLEYSSILRIEEDISARVRSLLISRNRHHPPHTPSPSQEDVLPHLREAAKIGTFDFGSARSVAKQARLDHMQSGRRSLPIFIPPRMTVEGLSRQGSEPIPQPLKDIEAADDGSGPEPAMLPSALEEGEPLDFPRKVWVDKSRPDETLVRSCLVPGPAIEQSADQVDPCDLEASGGEIEHFHFPRLFLDDKSEPDNTVVRSCLFPGARPEGRTKSPQYGQEPEVFEGDPIIDESCFPDSDEDHLLPSVPKHIIDRSQQDQPRNLVMRVVNDVRKHGVAAITPGHTHEATNGGSPSSARRGSSSRLPHISTRRSSFQSSAPSRKVSRDIERTLEHEISRMSTPKARTEDTHRIRHLSDVPLQVVPDTPQIAKTKQYNPSLLSAASTSSVKHPLLKTSVSSFRMLESELPVPPKLTTVAIAPQVLLSHGLPKGLSEPSNASSTTPFTLQEPTLGFDNIENPNPQESSNDSASKLADFRKAALPSEKVSDKESREKEMDNRQRSTLAQSLAPPSNASNTGASLDVGPFNEHAFNAFAPVPDVVRLREPRSSDRSDALTQQISRETMANPSPSQKKGLLGMKKLNWFPDLLSAIEVPKPYQTQLTAMPPKSRQKRSSFGDRQNSLGSTVYPQGESQFEPKLQSYAYMPQGPKESLVSSASEAFTKTLSDLEHLLNEALFIARLAVNKEDAPSILETATELLKGQRGRSYAGSVHESICSMSSSGSWSSQDSDISTELPANELSVSSGAQVVQPTGDWPPGLPWIKSEPQSTRQEHMSPSQNKELERFSRASNDLPDKKFPGISMEDSGNSTLDLVKRLSPAENGRCKERTSQYEKEDTASLLPIPLALKPLSRQPATYSEDDPKLIIDSHLRSVKSRNEVREYIRVMHEPPIQPRASSKGLSQATLAQRITNPPIPIIDIAHGHSFILTPSSSFRSLDGQTEVDFNDSPGRIGTMEANEMRDGVELENLPDSNMPQRHISGKHMQDYSNLFDLKNRSHISLREHKGFSLARANRRQPVARDWSPFRKRFVASVACISTALIGVLIGIYAGEVPSMQYYIADMHHFVILGNVFFFVGLAIPTLYFWPLPLMHGRKPYTLAAMTIAMPLLFPQAVAVSAFRSPYVAYWRIGLLLPRASMGFALGFANMNFKYTLMDLFGASLQSGNPHQEVVDVHDVRRHGGGMGVWLGIWTWCSIGSIGVGFLIGAAIINTLNPAWGFYISIILIAAVLLLNVVCPEVRRSAFRRSVVEVKNQDAISRRLARGEIMMHRKQTGPTWWGQEVHHGMLLTQQMLRQPGFLVMALYVAWIYAQVVLIIVLLGSLTSRYYFFRSPEVGASVSAVPIGVLLSVPFQKASIFSRARHNSPKTNTMTVDETVHMSSHVIRRAIFTLVLPFAGMAYTVSSSGPPTPFIFPILFAALIGFLSGLAIAECHGIIMETFDTSDLQPGMTGRPRGRSGDKSAHKRTNYSSFPRVSSAFAITQSFGYLLAAGATGVGGVAQRHIGQQAATGVMAGILLLLTFLLLGVLIRFQDVQIIPDSRKQQMEEWKDARRASIARNIANGKGEEEREPWRPIILGNPTGVTRRMSVLELGGLSRWSEIRKKNRLIDETSLEANHPNLAAIGSVRDKMMEEKEEIAERVSREMDRALEMVSISRSGSRAGSRKSEDGHGVSDAGDLGGNVEVTVEHHARSMKKPSSGVGSGGSRRRVSEVREIVRKETSVG
ncbi:hypothetical protein BP5796_04493 [Coleophoma crateriformis]|uniref:Polyamine transport protein n=1 Tax=Coleophoma crateriformis TaxID=565419 RepID=A0A3D8S9H3_9HELO|nr:hypothetical protein BP5796_04493 [Coleophoma crateriformis]